MAYGEKDKEFFLATRDKIGDYLIYSSEAYSLSEVDLINLIKICLVERRSIAIGRKLVEVYRDGTKEREDITEQRLNIIGVKDDGKREPTKRANPKTK